MKKEIKTPVEYLREFRKEQDEFFIKRDKECQKPEDFYHWDLERYLTKKQELKLFEQNYKFEIQNESDWKMIFKHKKEILKSLKQRYRLSCKNWKKAQKHISEETELSKEKPEGSETDSWVL